MNAHKNLKRHEIEGCESAGFAGNIQEVILSEAHQGCLLRLEYSIPNRSRSFLCQWNISESYSKAECLKAQFVTG